MNVATIVLHIVSTKDHTNYTNFLFIPPIICVFRCLANVVQKWPPKDWGLASVVISFRKKHVQVAKSMFIVNDARLLPVKDTHQRK